MIAITPRIWLNEDELAFAFVQAAGPGGQNVNKVATAAELRFDVQRSASLPEPVRQRLRRLAGNRLTAEGILVIRAHCHRSQERNRADAQARLCALIRQAAVPPRPRKPTRPPKAAKERRLKGKRQRSETKGLRQRTFTD